MGAHTRLILDHAALALLAVLAKAAVETWPLSKILEATARLERRVPQRAQNMSRASLAALERATRRAGRLVGATCLPRALALRWWLRGAYSQDVALVIGVRTLEHGAIGHAWLEVTTNNQVWSLLEEPGEDHGTPIREARLRTPSTP